MRSGIITAQPIKDFVTATEAAELLGVSRQALHKRGGRLIYRTMFGRRWYYLRSSVLLFKDTGDGRHTIYGPQSATWDKGV